MDNRRFAQVGPDPAQSGFVPRDLKPFFSPHFRFGFNQFTGSQGRLGLAMRFLFRGEDPPAGLSR